MKKKIQKTNAMRVLEKNKIDYTVHEYPWNDEHTDAQSAADKISMPLHKIYKTLVAVGSQTGVIVACIPASSELDLKKFAKTSGNKSGYAPYEWILRKRLVIYAAVVHRSV